MKIDKTTHLKSPRLNKDFPEIEQLLARLAKEVCGKIPESVHISSDLGSGSRTIIVNWSDEEVRPGIIEKPKEVKKKKWFGR
ncbi:MAG: hypothetical protein ACE5FU_12970 [Nitrospinota bacterium]